MSKIFFNLNSYVLRIITFLQLIMIHFSLLLMEINLNTEERINWFINYCNLINKIMPCICISLSYFFFQIQFFYLCKCLRQGLNFLMTGIWQLIRYYFGMSYSTCSLIITFDSMKSANNVSIGRLTGNKCIKMLWRFLWKHFVQCWRNAFKDMIDHNAVDDADPWMYWILSHISFKTTWFLQAGMKHTFHSVAGTWRAHVRENRCYFHQVLSLL
jgi:hypothetical protein